MGRYVSRVVGTAVSALVGDDVGFSVGEGGTITLTSPANVTLLVAKVRPIILLRYPKVTETCVSRVPTNTLYVPIVALVPTAHQMLAALAPLTSAIDE